CTCISYMYSLRDGKHFLNVWMTLHGSAYNDLANID
ncbi:unnamed protein product, partial [marine sediment metagenome]